MIEFIKKYLFGKTLSQLQDWESVLNNRELSLNGIESELIEFNKNLESKELILHSSIDSVENERKHVESIKNDVEKRLLEVLADKEKLSQERKGFKDEMNFLIEKNNLTIDKLKFMRSKLRNFDKELKEKAKELEALETFLQTKIEQKENLEVNNMSTIISRGKEIIIDKYGNFKGFV